MEQKSNRSTLSRLQESKNIVDIRYRQTGEASATNELGMREMQAKAYEARDKRFLLMVHQILKPVQFHVTVVDDNGVSHEPKEWFVIPLNVVDTVIARIMDGSILGYTYNASMKCLEKRVVSSEG